MKRTILALAVAGLALLSSAGHAGPPPIPTTNVNVVNTPSVTVSNPVLPVEVSNSDAIPVTASLPLPYRARQTVIMTGEAQVVVCFPAPSGGVRITGLVFRGSVPHASRMMLYGSIHDASDQDVATGYAEYFQPPTDWYVSRNAQLNLIIVSGEQFCVTVGKEGEGSYVVGEVTVTGER